MKKTIMCFLLILSGVLIFAQTAAPETVSVSGKLALANGRIALQSGENLYYVAGIRRLIGFIDGLKEGAQVSLEGYARNEPGNVWVLWATKLTLGGKSYDLAPAGFGRNGFDRNARSYGGPCGGAYHGGGRRRGRW